MGNRASLSITGELFQQLPHRLPNTYILGLLSQLAGEHPLLCVVDDAQWLDRESAQALAFVARRLATESIAFAFGSRAMTDVLRGLPTLEVAELDRAFQRAGVDTLRFSTAEPFAQTLQHFFETRRSRRRG